MFSWFDMAMARRVDVLTMHHCKRTSDLGELHQLSKLFGARYLSALHHLMAQGLVRSAGPAAILEIKLGWIDKIPLAKPDGSQKKTELGDAVLFAIEETRVAGQQLPIIVNARAAILQAKVTQAYRHMRQPKVPVASMRGSTKDEFNLLSAWPKFDLYKTSGSASPLATKLEINTAGAVPPPYGWYLAAPRARQVPKYVPAIWPSWWMLGPAFRDHECNVTFGTFLRSFLNNLPLPITGGVLAAGAPFHHPSKTPPKASLSDWDRLCAEIIAIVEDPFMRAPQSIFGAATDRMVSMGRLFLSFISPIAVHHELWRYPYRIWRRRGPYGFENNFIWHAHRPVPPHSRARRHPRRRLPVLIVRSIIYEGESPIDEKDPI